MPKLGRYSPLLNSTFLLYKTKEDAEREVDPQGTGFFVAVPFRNDPKSYHLHGVTNWHVAINYLPAPCIRINTFCGKGKVLDFDPSEWVCEEDSYDIAISPPLLLNPKLEIFSPLGLDLFMSPEEELRDEIGPCDDVFMTGLFVDDIRDAYHSPAFRFGHISLMNAQVLQETGYMGRSIMLDMNSRSGFSGSPVFVFRTLGSHFIEQAQPGQVLTGGGHYMKLLGIHWGQVKEKWEVANISKGEISSKEAKDFLKLEGRVILGLSGMTYVIPAACIREILNLPELQSTRTADNVITV